MVGYQLKYEQEDMVCPSKLRSDLFTTAAVNNIHRNPSSTTSGDSFHGTAISLVQHPTTENKEQNRPVDSLDPSVPSTSIVPSYVRYFRTFHLWVCNAVSFILFQLMPIWQLKQQQPTSVEIRRTTGSNTHKISCSKMNWMKVIHRPEQLTALRKLHHCRISLQS